jgi:hypothetical protein
LTQKHNISPAFDWDSTNTCTAKPSTNIILDTIGVRKYRGTDGHQEFIALVFSVNDVLLSTHVTALGK